MPTTPFWICRDLTAKNKKDWAIWAKEHALMMIPVDKLHFTQLYSKSNTAEWPLPMESYFSVRPSGVGNLGDATVVFFDVPEQIKSRFSQLTADHPHTFSHLLPHMTLIYEKSSQDDLIRLMEILPNAPSLDFGPEIVNPISQDFDTKSIPVVDYDLSALVLEFTQDIAKRADTDRSRFLTAFGKALANSPELVEAWSSGDLGRYKKAWAKVLQAMPVGASK